jgi:hypothetical protein
MSDEVKTDHKSHYSRAKKIKTLGEKKEICSHKKVNILVITRDQRLTRKAILGPTAIKKERYLP